jgi:hypothetical protein
MNNSQRKSRMSKLMFAQGASPREVIQRLAEMPSNDKFGENWYKTKSILQKFPNITLGQLQEKIQRAGRLGIDQVVYQCCK